LKPGREKGLGEGAQEAQKGIVLSYQKGRRKIKGSSGEGIKGRRIMSGAPPGRDSSRRDSLSSTTQRRGRGPEKVVLGRSAAALRAAVPQENSRGEEERITIIRVKRGQIQHSRKNPAVRAQHNNGGDKRTERKW